MIRFPSICSAWIPDMNVRHPYSSYSPFDCIRFHMHLLTSTKIHSQFFKRKTLYGHLITIHFIFKDLFYLYQKNTPQKQKDPVIFVFPKKPAAAEIAPEFLFQELSMPTFFESLGHKRNPLRRFGGFVRLF